MEEAQNFLKTFNRIVLAEPSLEEIIQIKFQTGLEIESFGYGALCFAILGSV